MKFFVINYSRSVHKFKAAKPAGLFVMTVNIENKQVTINKSDI